ncbi:MAG: pfrC, partial [Bacteroidetes bacterium]|nr:pfrC [Bacteroidota bacterium]
GPLQFEVVQYRLENEYGATSRLEQTEWKLLRWVDPAVDQKRLANISLPTGSALVESTEQQLAIFFTGEWAVSYFAEKNPEIALSEMPYKK